MELENSLNRKSEYSHLNDLQSSLLSTPKISHLKLFRDSATEKRLEPLQALIEQRDWNLDVNDAFS